MNTPGQVQCRLAGSLAPEISQVRHQFLARRLWQAGRIGAVGLIAGLAMSLALTRTLSGVLFGVNVLDPWLFVGTGAALLVAVAAASYLPARRAARTGPMMALRAE